MQMKSTIELLIRIVFAIWFFISLIGFLWFASSRDEMENLIFLILISTLLFSALKSVKSSKIFSYISMNVLGLLSSAFLGYKTIFVHEATPLAIYLLPNILLCIGFSFLIYLALKNKRSS